MKRRAVPPRTPAQTIASDVLAFEVAALLSAVNLKFYARFERLEAALGEYCGMRNLRIAPAQLDNARSARIDEPVPPTRRSANA